MALTLRYGREALLAHYLRLTPYGNGSHGIAHAARVYFDKPVGDLSWAQIALLSAVPQSPTRMNLLRHDGLARAVRRGHRALDELARQGVIDEAELALAHRQLASLSPPKAPVLQALRTRSCISKTDPRRTGLRRAIRPIRAFAPVSISR